MVQITRSRNKSSTRFPLLQIFLTIGLSITSFYVGTLSSATVGNVNCLSNQSSGIQEERTLDKSNIDAIVQQRLESGMCMRVSIYILPCYTFSKSFDIIYINETFLTLFFLLFFALVFFLGVG
jgi:hypothetical protein